MEPIIDLRPCENCSQPLGYALPRYRMVGIRRRFCATCLRTRKWRAEGSYQGPIERRRRTAARSVVRLAILTGTRKERARAKSVSRGRERIVVPIDGLDDDLAFLVAQQAAEDTHISPARGLPSFLTGEYPE